MASIPPVSCGSVKSFFVDAVKPTAFDNMIEWDSTRDFLWNFGYPFRRHTKSGTVFDDKRVYAYHIAKCMNLIQEDYSHRLSVVGNQGRIVAEAFVAFSSPIVIARLMNEKKPLSFQIDSIGADRAMVSDLHYLRMRGNDADHLHLADMDPADKGKVVDAVFRIVRSVSSELRDQYPDEATRAVTWMRSVTPVQIWLASVGLEKYRSNFQREGYTNMDVLCLLRDDFINGVSIEEDLRGLSMASGDARSFKLKLRLLTDAQTVQFTQESDLAHQSRIDRENEETVLARTRTIEREHLRSEQERVRVEQERVRAEQERVRVEEEIARVEVERLRAEGARLRAEEERVIVEEKRRIKEEKERRIQENKDRVHRAEDALLAAVGKGGVVLLEEIRIRLKKNRIETLGKFTGGRTLLYWTSISGCDGGLKLLIDAGADVNSHDNAGANINAKNSGGETSLMLAVKAEKNNNSGVVKLLLDAGADVNSHDNAGANINAKNRDGETALMMAAEHSHSGIVYLLLDAGADVKIQDNRSRRASKYANKQAIENLLIAAEERPGRARKK